LLAEEDLEAPPEDRLLFEWLISPIGQEVFFEEYWEKQPLVIRRKQPDYFRSLLSLDEVDRALTTLDLGYPNVTLKNADRTITVDDYTVHGDSLDVAKVYQLFGEGSTITLAFLDNVIPALASFCRGLEKEFSCPLQTNAYLTPAGAKGARHHYDTHDVFVLQVLNSKQWTTYGTPVELPLRGQDFDSAVHELGAPTLSFGLNAGDIAYIPRGVVHNARSGDDVSLHITLGVLGYTWADLLLELAADVSLHDPAFRKSLPPGFAREEFDRAQAGETFRNLLQQLSAKSPFDKILDRFIDESLSASPPLLRGQMGQMASLDRLTLDSVVGARPNVRSRVRTNRGSMSIDCYGREITLPLHAAEAVRFALDRLQFVVRQLPGDFADEAKLALVRRLIREGLVMALS
jgi:ribosomal protein L16 Arg81 hydroxylase